MYEKLYQLPEYYTMFDRKIFFLPIFFLGGGATAVPAPTSYAYASLCHYAPVELPSVGLVGGHIVLPGDTLLSYENVF